MSRVLAFLIVKFALLLLLNLLTVNGSGADADFNRHHQQHQHQHQRNQYADKQILNSIQINVPIKDTEHLLRKQQQQQFTTKKAASYMQLQPAALKFGDTFIGSTRSFQVTLINTHETQSVQLLSSAAKSNNPAFFCNLPSHHVKTLPPRRNLTLEIGFLPWKEGMSETELVLQTTAGQVSLPVSGLGQQNPYRLKPMLELKAPLNSTLAPEIHMYNPHDRPLQIMEVYSSGGKFQLELPSGGSEGPQALWNIPPFTTKPIIRIRFHGIASGNYTAYIRVKISLPSLNGLANGNNEQHIFVVPIEFEIMPHYGLYLENPVIDFGRITADRTSDKLYFNLPIQSSHRQRHFKLLQSIDNEVLKYDSKEQRLIFDPSAVNHTTSMEQLLHFAAAASGKTEPQSKFTLILRGEIYRGRLAYDKNQTIFVQQPPRNEKSNEPKLLWVQNKFDIPMALKNITLLQSNSSMLELTILKDLKKLVLLPQMRLNLLQLKSRGISANYQSIIRIYTNISLFEIPVVLCSGRLHVTTQNSKRFHLDEPYNTELNLGAIPLAELSHEAYILLRNPNAITVKLNNWDFQSTEGVYFHTTFLGCFNATTNDSTIIINLDDVKFNFCSAVNMNEVGVFKVAIQPYITEHQYATLKIWTPYEVITNTIKFFTWVGSLEIEQEQIQFNDCFPGKICTSELNIHSSFEQPIHLISVAFGGSQGFSFLGSKAKDIVIAPRSTTNVGRIRFEPGKLCGSSCYIAWNATKNAFDEVPYDGTDAILNFDLGELRSRVERYRHLKWKHKSATITLNSREIQEFDLQFALDMEWPKLVKVKPSTPVQEVGKATHIYVNIVNPADTPLLVDYFLSNPLLAKQTKFSLPPEVVETSSSCYLTDEFVFDLPNGMPSVPILVPVGKSLKVPISFGSQSSGTYCTLLHIRNNLTLYEAVWITGQTVQSQFWFDNLKPGAKEPLIFEITAAELPQHCDKHTPIMVRRSFIARNLGDIPIKISKFYIDDAECFGYGFRVTDCSEFVLAANTAKKIELIFQPDFTELVVNRVLTLQSNLSYAVQYLLAGYISRDVDLSCAEASLSRPPWEKRLRFIAIIVLLVSLLLVVVAAHIDYNNLLAAQSTLFYKRDKGSMHPTFNLRNIAIKAQQEAAEEQSAAEKRKAQSLQQQKAAAATTAKYSNNSNSSNNSSTFLRKRDTKRYFANGNGITFSERQFKLKQEADRLAREESANEDSNGKQASRGGNSKSASGNSKANDREELPKSSPKEKESKLQAKKQQQQPPVAKGGNKKASKAAQVNQKEEKPKITDCNEEEQEQEQEQSDRVMMEVEEMAMQEAMEAKLPEQPKQSNNSDPPATQEQCEHDEPETEEKQTAEEPAAAAEVCVEVVEKHEAAPAKHRPNPFESAENTQLASQKIDSKLQCITSPWDTSSHVTFSEVFPAKANAMSANEEANSFQDPTNFKDSKQSVGQRRNVDLGPIGSRRSPTLANANYPVQSSLFAEFLSSTQFQQQQMENRGNNIFAGGDWRSNAQYHQQQAAQRSSAYLPELSLLQQQQEERHKLLESLERSPINNANLNRQHAATDHSSNWLLSNHHHQQQQQQVKNQQQQHRHYNTSAAHVPQQQHSLLDTLNNYPGAAYDWSYNHIEPNWSPFANVPSNNYARISPATISGSTWLGGGGNNNAARRPPPGLRYSPNTTANNITPPMTNHTQQQQAQSLNHHPHHHHQQQHDQLINSLNNYDLNMDNTNVLNNDGHGSSLWHNNNNNNFK